MNFITLSLIFFLIMDPVGNIAPFNTMVAGIEPKKRRWIVWREMVIALVVIFFFNFLGEYIFNILSLSETSVYISSGLILFLAAIQILFPTLESLRLTVPREEPFITPLAIPLIAGPSLLATVMLFARMEDGFWPMTLAILTAWLAAVVVLLLAQRLQKLLGDNGLLGLEKLLGMVLVLLGTQRFLDGITRFINELP